MPEAQQNLYQDLLPGLGGLAAAVDVMREAGAEERGAVFTRREVVEFILDLAGYDVGMNDATVLRTCIRGLNFTRAASIRPQTPFVSCYRHEGYSQRTPID